MADRCKDNVIEWIEGDKTATFTFSQKKFVNRMRRMVENGKKGVEITHENPDGSIMGHIPVRAIHLTVFEPKNSEFQGGSENGKDDS